MLLLVSGYARAHTDKLQYGVSIRISINLGKTFLRISCVRKIAMTRILTRNCRFTFFLFSDSETYLLNGFDFYFNKPYVK